MYITVYLHNTFREDLSLVNKRGDGLLFMAIDWMSPHHICEHPPKLAIKIISLLNVVQWLQPLSIFMSLFCVVINNSMFVYYK